MPKPNFFIVGAPKCGTSSLFHLVKSHPQVFTPIRKEPAYFAPQRTNRVKTLEEYLAMFDEAKPEQKAVGEGSTTYLYHPGSLEAIKEFDPNARIVIMLREPVSLAKSMHQFLVYLGIEDVVSFREAWRLQDERAQGRNLPPETNLALQHQYGFIALLGKHLEHAYSVFPKEQVLVIFLEDFGKDPASVYAQFLAHIGVDHDGRTEFPRANVGHLAGGSARAHGKLRTIAYKIKEMIPVKGNWHKSPAVRKLNSFLVKAMSLKKQRKEELAADFKNELRDFFEADVQLLERLTGRDLPHWRK